MTMDRSPRAERVLPGLLVELADARTPDYLEAAIEQASSRPQRPSWTFPERWLPVADITSRQALAPAPPWRLLAVALLLVALLVGAVLVVGSQQQRLPAPFGPAANGLIAYAANGDIYVGDPVTGSSRLVIGGADDDSAPGFSPDGSLIALFRSAGDDAVDIYTARPDGSDLKRVTTAPIALASWVQWTPDSRHLAVVRAEGADDRLDVIDLDGDSQRLAGDMSVETFAFRPPLGQEILFRAVKDGRRGLYLMNVDGSDLRPLLMSPNPLEMDQDLNSATYSADGEQIFYQHGMDGVGCCELWVMDADGSNQHRFLGTPAGTNWEGMPAISPDGRWLAFWQNISDQPTQQVSFVKADGTGPVIRSGPDLRGLVSWAWAPDSSKLLMVSEDGTDGPQPYLLDPDGGAWTTAPWRSTSSPDWQRLAP